MAGTVVDVTDRRLAEEAIRSASAYARSLIEASLDPLVVIGPDGKVTDVNAATEAMTGVPRGRLVGSDFADYFTEPEKARAGLQRVLSAGALRDHSLTIRHASGRTTEVIFSASVYAGPDGNVRGVFAAARDVTELRALQAKVALSARLAAMGTLVAGVAHEINNPLAAVMAGQGLTLETSRELRKRLQDRMLLDPETEIRQLDEGIEALEDAWEGGQRIAGIVKELAAIARPDPTRERVRLADVAAQAVRWVRPFLDDGPRHRGAGPGRPRRPGRGQPDRAGGRESADERSQGHRAGKAGRGRRPGGARRAGPGARRGHRSRRGHPSGHPRPDLRAVLHHAPGGEGKRAPGSASP